MPKLAHPWQWKPWTLATFLARDAPLTHKPTPDVVGSLPCIHFLHCWKPVAMLSWTALFAWPLSTKYASRAATRREAKCNTQCSQTPGRVWFSLCRINQGPSLSHSTMALNSTRLRRSKYVARSPPSRNGCRSNNHAPSWARLVLHPCS